MSRFGLLLSLAALAACHGPPTTSDLDMDPARATSDLGTDLARAISDLGPADSGLVPGVLSGCWITHTMSGTTRLDLIQQGMAVSGTLSWTSDVYPVRAGAFTNGALRFQVVWENEGFACQYDFSSANAMLLSGTATCQNLVQAITADRTCP